MTTLLFVISALLCVGFISHAVGRTGGLPDSISAIVFDMRHPWAWSLWLWGVGLTLAPALLEAMSEGWQWVAFLAIALLLFTGIFPLFDREHRRWHYILGFSSGLSFQTCVWFICPWWLLLWTLMVVYIIAITISLNERKAYDGKGVIIAELIAIAAVFASITTRMYL